MSRPAAISDPDWTEQAVRKIEQLARANHQVTSEDLRREFEPPENHQQYGAAFREAAARKLIIRVSRRPSRDKSRRGGVISVWVLHPSRWEES